MHKSLFYLLILLLLSVSCSKGELPKEDTAIKKIHVMYSPGGLGDSGYNDLILSGFQRIRLDCPEVCMIFYTPASIEDAQTIMYKWLNDSNTSDDELFVLASSDYENMLRELLERDFSESETVKEKDILLFESPNSYSLPVSTMRISIFGASYLAGISAADSCGDMPALVVGANPKDEPVLSAVYGFIEGWKSRSRSAIDTVYMSTDWNGFIQSEKAYQKMHEWSKTYGFVFSVAGGTNNGIYRYLRENPGTMKTTGMDVDQSYLCSDIIGSVLKHIDRLVYNMMTGWIETGKISAKEYYGLSDGYAQWLWPNEIDSDLMRTAIRLENEYEDR